MVVLTIFAMFGEQIIKFVSDMLFGKDKIVEVKDSLLKVQEELKNSASEFGTNFTLLKKLQTQWIALGSDIKKQKQFIIDNKEEFNKLDVAITNVNDANNLFIENTDAFIKSMKARAMATAAMKLASEQYGKMLELQMKRQQVVFEKPSFGAFAMTTVKAAVTLEGGTLADVERNRKKDKIEELKKRRKSCARCG